MKTVLIHGQNHRGSSYHIGNLLSSKVATEGEIREFFLPKDLNHFCMGCCRCLEDEALCPFYAEKQIIENAMRDAELLVFTTPTYCMRASAPMKSFIDLTFTYWLAHRPKPWMYHKKAVVISTAAGAGSGSAIKDIKNSLFFWGVSHIQTLGVSVQARNWQEVSDKKKRSIERRVDKLAASLRKTGKPRVSLMIRLFFHIFRSYMNNEKLIESPVKQDYLYWKNMGWFGKNRPWKSTSQGQ